MAVIGLDLGGTKLAGALFADSGEMTHRATRPLEGRGGDEVGVLVAGELAELSRLALARGDAVRGVGVSVPGIAHGGDGTVWAPNIPGWEQYPLRSRLQERVGPSVAVAIDNDRACSILGEAAQGSARGFRHAIFMAVGTGIGAGVLIDGQVLRGAHDIAGAIGWMALDRPYRDEYDRCGCFETHASGAGLEHQARKLLAERPGHPGRLGRVDPAGLTAADVFTAADEGDDVALRVVANAIECWAMATANLVSLFNPEVIVFGGGVFGPAARWLARIESEARRWAQPISMSRVVLRATALGPDACLVGTGELARRTVG